MKKKHQEIVFGYAFISPVILGIIIFVVIPMITSFWYSLTDYNPLAVQTNSISINLQEELDMLLGVTPETVGDPELFAESFNAVDFIENDLLLPLNSKQRSIVASSFDSAQLARDLSLGKLNRIEDGVTILKPYLGSRVNEIFPRYTPTFVGIDNFSHMFFKDQYFWLVLWNTISYAIIVVVIQTFLSIILAVAANSANRGVGALKLIYFLPAITSSSAISMIFWMIYSKPGLLNQMLLMVGIKGVDWLNNPGTALPAVMALNIWTTAGFFMVTFLAGLQSIPRELYEAADIDGATDVNRFWNITFPLLRPQILYVMIMGTIGCLQVFDQIYYLCGTNMRTATMAFYIYKNGFFFGNMGYASSIALVLFAIILAVTVLQRRFVKESLI